MVHWSWRRTRAARGRFTGQEFEILETGTLRCPAEKILRPPERRTLSAGSVRIVFRAKKGDCRSCGLAPACLGRQASGAQPRRMSAVGKRIRQPVSCLPSCDRAASLPYSAALATRVAVGRCVIPPDQTRFHGLLRAPTCQHHGIERCALLGDIGWHAADMDRRGAGGSARELGRVKSVAR
jgi:hypothetical protein